jgi:hypothetical protein
VVARTVPVPYRRNGTGTSRPLKFYIQYCCTVFLQYFVKNRSQEADKGYYYSGPLQARLKRWLAPTSQSWSKRAPVYVPVRTGTMSTPTRRYCRTTVVYVQCYCFFPGFLRPFEKHKPRQYYYCNSTLVVLISLAILQHTE